MDSNTGLTYDHFLYSLKVLLENGRKVRRPARAISQLVKISQQLRPPTRTLFLCDALAEIFNVAVDAVPGSHICRDRQDLLAFVHPLAELH